MISNEHKKILPENEYRKETFCIETREAHYVNTVVFALFNIYVDFCFYIDKKYEKVRKVCDSKTLVGLARTLEVDDRFFDPFPAPDKYEVRYISFIFISELLQFSVYMYFWINCFGRGNTASYINDSFKFLCILYWQSKGVIHVGFFLLVCIPVVYIWFIFHWQSTAYRNCSLTIVDKYSKTWL